MGTRADSVTVVIPNWNGRALLERHLPAVIRHTKGCRIIVVDDASEDDSAEFLEHTFPSVTLIRKDKHEGFASAVNDGVAQATSEIVLLLNSDIEPESGFLEPLLSHFTDSEVFAVGCMDKSREGGKTVLRGRGLGWWQNGMFVHTRGEVDRSDTAWVSGGSGAFRRSMWNRLNGMDTLYNPFYWEDIDLSYRARKAGWKILFEPKSTVIHRHEEGTIKRNTAPDSVLAVSYRNQFIFVMKNASDPSIIMAYLLRLPFLLTRDLVGGRMLMVKGWWMAMGKLPQILARRKTQKDLYRLSDRQLSMHP